MTSPITVVGLGPAGLDRLRPGDLEILTESSTQVIVRTIEHPAASELAARRAVTSCDDLYETGESFDAVYDAIVDRVLAAAEEGSVAYAVPGSAAVGELGCGRVLDGADDHLRRRFGQDLQVTRAEPV
ncbi:MAG: hypothetical protein ABFS21_00175, partial [Actinomycetota bacterium]